MGPIGWIQSVWAMVIWPFGIVWDFLCIIGDILSAILGIKLFTVTGADQNLPQANIAGDWVSPPELIAAEAGQSWVGAIIDDVRVWVLSPLMAPVKYLWAVLGVGEILGEVQHLVGWVWAGFQTHVRNIYFRLNKISLVGFLLDLDCSW